MKYFFVIAILCFASFSIAQESESVYDTSFYSTDSSYILLNPDYNLGHNYTYEVESYNLRVKNGDTTHNKKTISNFSFTPKSIDSDGIDLELFLMEDYWKRIVLYDSIYSSWSVKSIPRIHLNYSNSQNNFEIKNHIEIGDNIYPYIKEAKTYTEQNTSADYWDKKIAEKCFSKCRDSIVIRNWVSFSNGPYSLFTYYSFLFPKNAEINYALSQKRDEYETSTYFNIISQPLKNGNIKYTIKEDLSKAKNSSDRAFDKMVEFYLELDSTKTTNQYGSETTDETYVIVNKQRIIIEATSISKNVSILKSGTSIDNSVYSIKLVE